jgi:ketosteroid isomerase-like protein
MSRLTETIRYAYQAFADDPEALWDLLDDGAVFHVSGDHPLSGDYVGVAEIRRYLSAVREATGGRGGFSVTSAFADDSGDVVLVEGTAFHGEGPYVRTVVHRLRLSDGKLVEYRDHPFDQQTENRFWRTRVPAQRAVDGATADRVGAEQSAAAHASGTAVIPAQPKTTHVTRG